MDNFGFYYNVNNCAEQEFRLSRNGEHILVQIVRPDIGVTFNPELYIMALKGRRTYEYHTSY